MQFLNMETAGAKSVAYVAGPVAVLLVGLICAGVYFISVDQPVSSSSSCSGWAIMACGSFLAKRRRLLLRRMAILPEA
jgi:hypothetical protein